MIHVLIVSFALKSCNLKHGIINIQISWLYYCVEGYCKQVNYVLISFKLAVINVYLVDRFELDVT